MVSHEVCGTVTAAMEKNTRGLLDGSPMVSDVLLFPSQLQYMLHETETRSYISILSHLLTYIHVVLRENILICN